MTPEANFRVRSFLRTQECGRAYRNAGGMPDEYYTQYGVLCSLAMGDYSLWKCLYALKHRGRIRLNRQWESQGEEETMYTVFFRFLQAEMSLKKTSVPQNLPTYACPDGGYANTNSTCCALCMQYQVQREIDEKAVQWLCSMQHESGGFLAHAGAQVPDLLSTAVALFTLQLLGRRAPRQAMEFVDAHWMENGGFMPTLGDPYSDVEYVFYGLLAIGSL